MHLDYLRTLYGYNDWANRRILDTAERLTPEQLHTDGIASFGSIHATLVHTMGVQWLWFRRLRGESPAALPDAADVPDLAAIRARWAGIEADTQRFIAALEPEGENAPNRVVTYARMGGQPLSQPAWEILLHVVNHSTQHRSEVAAMLTQFGHSPGDLDLTKYLRER